MSVYESGKNIISLYYALMKAVQVYGLNNEVVQKAAKRFSSYINSLFNIYPRITLVRYRDYIFFNKQRLRFEIDGYASIQFVHDKLKKSNIKSLTLSPGIDKDEIITFASIFKEEQEIFLKKFAEKNLDHIEIEFSTGEEELPDFLQDGERIRKTYFSALSTTRNLMHNLRAKKPIDIRSSKHIVYSLIDSLFQDEFGLLALTALKNFDEYTYNHSLNVGILSLALGQRIGLNKNDLVKLGTSGILHDVGKVIIPKELIYKSQKLTDEEWETLKQHSYYGVKQILKIHGLDEIALISMIVAYQHHWNYDGTGYPAHRQNQKPILFSKIVRICDSYDAMTTPRTYVPIPYLPHLALQVLWSKRNVFFDPILVKIFTQLLGQYPIESCLELNNGEIGLVVRQNQINSALPIIKIVVNKDEKKIDGKMIDLSVQKELKIVRAVYLQKYGINPASYFVQDFKGLKRADKKYKRSY